VIPIVLAATASAGEWRDPRPFIAPILNVSIVSSGGASAAQASAGLVGGVNVRYNRAPHWVSTTRAQGVGFYGINTGSIGADLRVGSFIGPDFKLLKFQAGPDIFYNGYGQRGAIDWFLPWTAGVDLRTVTTLKIAKPVRLIGEATPGWVFNPKRVAEEVAPAHELTLSAILAIDAGQFRINVGYARQYRSIGTIDGLILSGGF
jgi:hypothetical protein